MSILETLNAAGHQALWVGGYVRDTLLGLAPVDRDVATSATPEEVLALFPHAVNAAQAYPVVIVDGMQVATFRSDAPGAARRDLTSITTGATLEEDAARRDFTVNALYMDAAGNVLDPTGRGLEDLEHKRLRFVGGERQRISEDPIRILRAVKFAARLGFSITAYSLQAILDAVREGVEWVPERILPELTAMLVHPTRRSAVERLRYIGLLQQLLPWVAALEECEHESPYHQEGDVLEHTLMVLGHLPAEVSPALAWAALLHDIGKPATKDGGKFPGHAKHGARLVREEVAPALRWPSDLRDDVCWLVGHHMAAHGLHDMRRGKLATRYAHHPLTDDLLTLQRADNLGRIPQKHDARQAEAVARCREAVPRGRTLRDVGIDGRVLMERFGLTPGPIVGRYRAALEELMAEHPEMGGEGLLALFEERYGKRYADLNVMLEAIIEHDEEAA